MDLKQKLKELQSKVEDSKESITNEEATKNAFVMPFIRSLGYDIFNPVEVVPEFTAEHWNEERRESRLRNNEGQSARNYN